MERKYEEKKTENNKLDSSHNIISQIKPNEVQRISDFSWQLTFALKTFFSQDADKGQELGDLFQVEHSGVVELDDGHGLLVVGTAAAILPQASVAHQNIAAFRRGKWKINCCLPMMSLIKQINA